MKSVLSFHLYVDCYHQTRDIELVSECFTHWVALPHGRTLVKNFSLFFSNFPLDVTNSFTWQTRKLDKVVKG